MTSEDFGVIIETIDFARPSNNQKYQFFTPTGRLGQHLSISIKELEEKTKSLQHKQSRGASLSAPADVPTMSWGKLLRHQPQRG